MELYEMQKRVYENKVKHNFNVTDVSKEFCYLYGEVSEAYDAYNKNKEKEEIGLELADIAIYLLGISEILNINLEEEIEKKIKINEKRIYVSDGKSFKKIEGK